MSPGEEQMARAVLRSVSLLWARGNLLRWAVLSLPVLALLGGSVTSLNAQGTPSAERLALCASCHGPQGVSAIPENPHLAKLQQSYFARQMADFKSGKRKSDVMKGIVGTIDEKEFAELAAFYFAQSPPAPGKGDAKLTAKGKEIFYEGIVANAVPACSGCHRDDGTGTNRYPRIAGQNPAYLVQQMLAYKSGARDNDDRGLMRTVAQRMNEEEIRAVAEFIVTMKGDEE
jgi:cytochrome c553